MPRRRRPSHASPATLPDDDDLLSEILLRLPPQPSSLPRASLVCKRWRRLVTEPHFRRCFRARHRRPPLIGFFDGVVGHNFFRRALLSAARRGRGGCEPKQWRIFGCRHGRVLVYNRKQKEIVLWDPPTGDHRRVAVPPEFDNEDKTIWNGAVLSAAGDRSHVHGGFCSCPFKVAIVGVASNHTQVFACIYSSETGKWSDLVSAAVPFTVDCFRNPGTLVGNALYWMAHGHEFAIVEFDLDRHSLAVIEWPSGAEVSGNHYSQIVLTEGGGLGLANLSRHSLQMWERKVCSEGVAKWVLRKSDKLRKILGQRSSIELILGYADEINVMLLWIDSYIYVLQLDSLQFTKLWETPTISRNHPYANIYGSVLHSRVQSSQSRVTREGGEMTRRRRNRTRPRPAGAVNLPDDDDLLSEILLRLPPQPSSLPRASLVCKRWRRLVTDPHFRRRFRARHRRPPLIGVFEDHGYPLFRSVMDPPDLIPAERFCPRLGDDKGGCEPDKWKIYGCRHGCMLLYNRKQKEIVLWDPPTGDRRVAAVPPELDNEEKMIWNGAVLCAAAGDSGHVHGGLGSCSFEVALKTHNLCKIHGMGSGSEMVLGYAEDANVMLIWTVSGVYMLQLDSCSPKNSGKLSPTDIIPTQVSMIRVYELISATSNFIIEP
ncbi:hypothetical protein C2845_PM13G10890 [Panicum miliaceum]|uniref:F-box domain-containing protein n=1 Tax=Panicum miliaceum TaxID=4540 RepID=A0A3L6RL67_PANMI|nr:hypothetical protein C2845_PM13G10890 [Panicum miliaceum]